jgi:hypothetical protein
MENPKEENQTTPQGAREILRTALLASDRLKKPTASLI